MSHAPVDRIVVARTPTPEERGTELERRCREIERAHRRDVLRTLGACLGWSALGALGMGASFASTDQRLAPVLFMGSMLAGYAGAAFTLLGAYRRYLEREGDW